MSPYPTVVIVTIALPTSGEVTRIDPIPHHTPRTASRPTPRHQPTAGRAPPFVGRGTQHTRPAPHLLCCVSTVSAPHEPHEPAPSTHAALTINKLNSRAPRPVANPDPAYPVRPTSIPSSQPVRPARYRRPVTTNISRHSPAPRAFRPFRQRTEHAGASLPDRRIRRRGISHRTARHLGHGAARHLGPDTTRHLGPDTTRHFGHGRARHLGHGCATRHPAPHISHYTLSAPSGSLARPLSRAASPPASSLSKDEHGGTPASRPAHILSPSGGMCRGGGVARRLISIRALIRVIVVGGPLSPPRRGDDGVEGGRVGAPVPVVVRRRRNVPAGPARPGPQRPSLCRPTAAARMLAAEEARCTLASHMRLLKRRLPPTQRA